MEKDLILTCDAGTTASKCTLFRKDGTALCAVRKEYTTEFPRPNWSEQSPDKVLASIVEGIKELLMQISPERIACVGLSGTMNGCIAVDGEGNALYPNIIHSDSRADKEAEEIASFISPSDFYRLTGNRLNNHYTLPKILWMRKNHPDIYQKTRWWLNTKDFVYGWLTGRFGVTDYSDASLTIALDIRKREWAGQLLADLGIDPMTMPQIRCGHDVSGHVRGLAARATGLLPGTPVAVGGGDGACAARGAGVHEPGSAYSCIGSSAWVSQMTAEPVLDPGERIFNYLDMDGKSNHVCGTVQCAAEAYHWAVRARVSGELDKGAAISRAENMARQVEPGAEGVLFLPTLMGERTPYWDANTKGCLVGFSLYHNKNHIARAVYEGVAFALKSGAEVMRECGVPVKSLMLTGGGASSGLWPDIMASVFGVETRVHKVPGEATSLGAAITAGVGVGLFEDYHAASRTAQARSVHPVNPAWQAKYEKVFPVYAKIYEGLKPVFDGIAALGNNG